jgi:hypothetical protein
MAPYGPDPSSEQIAIAVGPQDVPAAWAACLGVALVLGVLAWRTRDRPATAAALASLAHVAAATAPFGALLHRYVVGDYPTIDKQGSLLFYLEGVHVEITRHAFDLAHYAPARLIGVHMGHHWVTAAFDLVLEPFAAVNAQGVLWVFLAVFSAWAWFAEISKDPRVALLFALPWGLGLHVFADLNWYTIEKAAIFVLPSYAFCGLRAARDGGPWPWAAASVFAVATFLNLYLGVVIAFSAVVAALAAATSAWLRARASGGGISDVADALSTRRLVLSALTSAALVSPLVAAQMSIFREAPPLASPECFRELRAAHDVFALVPPSWGRLEWWAALHPLALAAASYGAIVGRGDRMVRLLLVVAVATGAIAVGPYAWEGVRNPVYMALWNAVPFFWRVSEPEVFFHVTWLCLLGAGAIGIADRAPETRSLLFAWAAGAAVWVLSTRMHPAFPGMSEYVPGKLSPGWERRLDRQPECSRIDRP